MASFVNGASFLTIVLTLSCSWRGLAFPARTQQRSVGRIRDEMLNTNMDTLKQSASDEQARAENELEELLLRQRSLDMSPDYSRDSSKLEDELRHLNKPVKKEGLNAVYEKRENIEESENGAALDNDQRKEEEVDEDTEKREAIIELNKLKGEKKGQDLHKNTEEVLRELHPPEQDEEEEREIHPQAKNKKKNEENKARLTKKHEQSTKEIHGDYKEVLRQLHPPEEDEKEEKEAHPQANNEKKEENKALVRKEDNQEKQNNYGEFKEMLRQLHPPEEDEKEEKEAHPQANNEKKEENKALVRKEDNQEKQNNYGNYREVLKQLHPSEEREKEEKVVQDQDKENDQEDLKQEHPQHLLEGQMQYQTHHNTQQKKRDQEDDNTYKNDQDESRREHPFHLSEGQMQYRSIKASNGHHVHQEDTKHHTKRSEMESTTDIKHKENKRDFGLSASKGEQKREDNYKVNKDSSREFEVELEPANDDDLEGEEMAKQPQKEKRKGEENTQETELGNHKPGEFNTKKHSQNLEENSNKEQVEKSENGRNKEDFPATKDDYEMKWKFYPTNHEEIRTDLEKGHSNHQNNPEELENKNDYKQNLNSPLESRNYYVHSNSPSENENYKKDLNSPSESENYQENLNSPSEKEDYKDEEFPEVIETNIDKGENQDGEGEGRGDNAPYIGQEQGTSHLPPEDTDNESARHSVIYENDNAGEDDLERKRMVLAKLEEMSYRRNLDMENAREFQPEAEDNDDPSDGIKIRKISPTFHHGKNVRRKAIFSNGENLNRLEENNRDELEIGDYNSENAVYRALVQQDARDHNDDNNDNDDNYADGNSNIRRISHSNRNFRTSRRTIIEPLGEPMSTMYDDEVHAFDDEDHNNSNGHEGEHQGHEKTAAE